METLDTLRRRIDSVGDLQGIVRTMKALSAASIRQFERSVEAIDAYNQTIEGGLRILLQDASAPDSPPARPGAGMLSVIFGSDQGMCGQFNENIVTFALRQAEASQQLLVVGLRAAAHLQEQGRSFAEVFVAPGSVEGINPAVQSLLLKVEALRAQAGLDNVMLYYNRPLSGATYQPVQVQLIPVDMEILRAAPPQVEGVRSLPLYTMERTQLLSALLRQYLFVQLYRAYAQSLASENASRLMTMQAAEKNIEERLAELNAFYHGQRQGLITSELLDIISGVEALSGATSD